MDHWFGTDSNGRDIFSRFVYGARVSLAIGVASLVFGLTIGGFLGLIAGYHRRRTDTFITTIMDILLAFPALVLALMLVTFGQAPDGGDRHFEIGPISLHARAGSWLVILVLSVLSIPPLTRVVRASTLTFANREFVTASRALGAKNGRVIGREILPNVIPPMLSFALTGARGAHRRRGCARVPRPVGATADAHVGVHDLRGQEPAADRRVVDLADARALHVPHDPRHQHARRRRSPALRHQGIRRVKKGQLAKLIAGQRTQTGPLLEVEDLKTHFRTDAGFVKAVDGVSFTLDRGKTIGVVGESGSGKTILSRSIMGLLPRRNVERDGRVVFEGQEIGDLAPPAMREIWGTEMAMIFQDPMTSLNPVMKIGRQITESLIYHLDMSKKDARQTADGAADVGRHPRARPGASTSTRTSCRAACASASRSPSRSRAAPRSCSPTSPRPRSTSRCRHRSSTCSRPSSRDRNMSMMLVTHDLGVVAGRTDEIAVMYAGKIVEKAPTQVAVRRTCACPTPRRCSSRSRSSRTAATPASRSSPAVRPT